MEETNSLKILILTIADYLKEILSKWYWYVLVGLLFGGLFYMQYKKQPENFVASGSLMTGGNSGGGLSSILQLAGQFGFGKPQTVSSDMLVDILSSETIIFKSLLESVQIEGKEDLLINHYLDFYKTDEESEVEGVPGFRFTTDSVDYSGNQETVETRLLKKVRKKIIRNHLTAGASKHGLVKVNFISESEGIAKWFVDKSISNLKEYYVEKSVKKEEEALTVLLTRLDSIKTAMESADYSLQSWYQKNQTLLKTGTVSPKEYMTKMKLERDATISSAAYTEALKNKEIAQMNYQVQMPMIQIVDRPIFPLTKEYPNLLKYIFYTFLLTAVPVTLLILLNKLIRDALKT